MSWKEHYFYAFPPFSVIAACLQKVDQNQAYGVLVLPIWQTPPWLTTLLHLLVDYPLRLTQLNHPLMQPHNGALHPLRKQLNLMACKLSGRVSNREMFQAKLLKSSSSLGQQKRKSSTRHTSHNRLTFVVNGRVIPITRLWQQSWILLSLYMTKDCLTPPSILQGVPSLLLLYRRITLPLAATHSFQNSRKVSSRALHQLLATSPLGMWNLS